jgi:hypothetical protein
MHDYSIDNHPKEKIIFFLAVIAIFTAKHINKFFNNLTIVEKLDLSFLSHLNVPVFALYGLIYFVFNKYLWKLKLFRKIFLIPDLNGNWTCSGETSIKEGIKTVRKWKGDLTITQSWSKIAVCLKSTNSESKSLVASIAHEQGSGFRLVYQYANNPNLNEPELQIHKGIAELLFDEDTKKASGHYFTDQHRSTVGSIQLRKK